MVLPESRNTTYAQGTQIKSADLNDIQDQIIGGKHGEKVLLIQAGAFEAMNISGTPPTFDGYQWTSNGAGIAECGAAIPLSIGDRIKSIKVYFECATDAANTAYFVVADMEQSDGTPLVTSDSDATPATTGMQVAEMTGINYTLADADGPAIIINFVDSVAGHHMLGAAVTYDRP